MRCSISLSLSLCLIPPVFEKTWVGRLLGFRLECSVNLLLKIVTGFVVLRMIVSHKILQVFFTFIPLFKAKQS